MADEVLSQFQQAAAEKEIDATKKLKVGIIGTGWIAESHIQQYNVMPDVEVVAMADLIPGKAEAFKEKWGVKGDVHFYPDHKSMIDNEELDAVSVCTYNATHAECTIYALEHGINVLLEKPMCVTLDEAAEIVKAEKKSGKILSIGFQPRYDANMQMIKKIVESGTLGEIYYIQTGGGRRRGIPNSTFIEKRTAGIGALGDIGCYSLDMVLNAIGYPTPKTISAYKSNFFGTSTEYQSEYDAKRFDVDDFAAAFIRLEPGKYGDKDGIILDFRIAWAMHVDTPGDTIIFGKKAALRIPSTDCWNGSVGGPMKIYHDIAGARVETVVPIIQNKGQGLFYKKVRSFLDAIKTGGTSPVPSSQIIKNQAILDGIVRSAEAGKEVDIVMPEV
ncbi:MAG TPA: Gfo/Idh/MocA family oxidoreductase [Firmicutes bacterium]|nr:Gfo/Idh/MocA family oxidoreductase [Bacillota bacterium]